MNLRLARPVILADRGAVPQLGWHHGRIRVRVVETLVATGIGFSGFIADLQPLNGTGPGMHSAHIRLPFSLK